MHCRFLHLHRAGRSTTPVPAFSSLRTSNPATGYQKVAAEEPDMMKINDQAPLEAVSREHSRIQKRRFSTCNNFRIIYTCLAILLSGWLLSAVFDQQKSRNTSSTSRDNHDYFSDFKGFAECNIRASELYIPPPQDQHGFHKPNDFCHDRKRLVEAMSGGGRIGFDAPYQSRGCSHRWFNAEEICFILERFDGLVFIGDDTLRTIHSGLNILLRQDLAQGALNLASMEEKLQAECRCENQFVKHDCRQHYLLDSARADQDDHTGTMYYCNRVRHSLLFSEAAQISRGIIDRFKQMVPKAPKSNYRPIPIIYRLAPTTASILDTGDSLKKVIELADESERNTPILWVGPTAAGHIELKDRKGNQEIWQFDGAIAGLAREHDVEVLGMWNLTAQATSWDGTRFGERVAITQAMMIVNWLSRLESS